MKRHLILSLLFMLALGGWSQSRFLLKDHPNWKCDDPSGSYALVDFQGKEVVPPMYVYIGKLRKGFGYYTGYAKARAEYKYSVMDSLGNFLTPQLYEDIAFYDPQGLSPVKMGGKWGLINAKFEPVIPCKYDELEVSKFPNLVHVGIGSDPYKRKWRVLDSRNGQQAFPVSDSTFSIFYFNEYFAVVAKDATTRSLISRSGKQVIPFIEAEMELPENSPSAKKNWFKNGITEVKIGEKIGLIDSTGQFILPAEFDYLEGGANLNRVGKRGEGFVLINRVGKLLTPFIPAGFESFVYGGGGILSRDDKQFYVDSLGVERLEFGPRTEYRLHESQSASGRSEYFGGRRGFLVIHGDQYICYDYSGNLLDSITEQHRGRDLDFRIPVQDPKTKLYGYTDKAGNKVIDYRYSSASYFWRDYAVVAEKSFLGTPKSGVIDSTGREVLPLKYDRILFYDSNMVVRLGDKYAIADAHGKLLTGFDYTDVSRIGRYLFRVSKNKLSGIVNTQGEETLACEYNPQSFIVLDNGMIQVEKNGSKGIVDGESGKFVIPCFYTKIKLNFNTLIVVGDGSKSGVIDRQGKELIPCVYDEIKILLNEKAIVAKKDGFWGMLDKSGNTVLPFVYDIIEPYYGDLLIVADGVYCL